MDGCGEGCSSQEMAGATKDEAAGPPDHSSCLKGTPTTRKRQETLLAMAPRAGAGTTNWGALGWQKPKVTQLS